MMECDIGWEVHPTGHAKAARNLSSAMLIHVGQQVVTALLSHQQLSVDGVGTFGPRGTAHIAVYQSGRCPQAIALLACGLDGANL